MYKILICGFSGSGKSTWLSELGKKSQNAKNIKFYDLDDLVASEGNIGPSELGKYIDSIGEFRFREIEFRILNQLLMNEETFILALGGGALNLEVLEQIKSKHKHTKLVFLNEDFEVCYSRIKNDANRLLSKLSEPELKKLFLKRMELYLQADLIVGPRERNLIEGLDTLVHTLGMK